MGSDNRELIRASFATQAAAMEDGGYVFADRGVSEWMLEHVPPAGARTLLDVAGGTGQVARAYAAEVSAAIVIDTTRALLERGRREAEALRNVVFEEGDAIALPYLDASFDLVVSRFAVHHFAAPAAPLAEMVRVCRPDGRVAVVDLVAAEAELSDEYNARERLRDPSHARALTADELAAAIEAAGARVAHRAERDRRIAVERWLAVTSTPPENARQLRADLQAELEGGPATGMRPVTLDGELHYTQRWAIVVASATR